MALFELSGRAVRRLQAADFAALGILERQDLQAALRDNVHVIVSDALVISEEFSGWDRSARRIDLLCVDREARLVVIELKRTTDSDLIDLQALRYAAMVSQMTFEEAVDTYKAYLSGREDATDARASLLDFLKWSEASDGQFGKDVRIFLAAADFSPEVTSTVIWLNERDVDITCVRLQPYRLNDTIVLDVQQIIPLPETADYQVRIRQRQREARVASDHASDRTRYDFVGANGRQSSLSKRDAVFAIVRYIFSSGVAPEEIEEAVGRQLFERVEGTTQEEGVKAELARRRPNDGIYPKRFFTSGEQLFSFGGCTYTLTNQWSRAALESLVGALRSAFPAVGFEIKPSTRPDIVGA